MNKVQVALFLAFASALVFFTGTESGGGGGYLKHILHHPLIQCRLKGGTCMNIDNCNTTNNIYKDICKSYNYNDVCCISRETICHKFSGFCTNSSDICIQAGFLHRGGYTGYEKKPVVLSWLACNSTHRCCHPVKPHSHHQHHIHDNGGYGNGGYGGPNHGHGQTHEHGHGHGHGLNYLHKK